MSQKRELSLCPGGSDGCHTCLPTGPSLSPSSYSFLGGRITVRRKRVVDTVLTQKNERKTVLEKKLLLVNLGTPQNFSGLAGAQQCSWSPEDPLKVWVRTVSSKVGLRLHVSNKVLLGNAFMLLLQGPHCGQGQSHKEATGGLPKHAHGPEPTAVPQSLGLECSWHWIFICFCEKRSYVAQANTKLPMLPRMTLNFRFSYLSK